MERETWFLPAGFEHTERKTNRELAYSVDKFGFSPSEIGLESLYQILWGTAIFMGAESTRTKNPELSARSQDLFGITRTILKLPLKISMEAKVLAKLSKVMQNV